MNTYNIYNDDAFNAIKNIQTNSVDMILTDIPYGEVNRKSGGLRNLDKGIADDFDNTKLNELIDEFNRVCTGNFYVFCGTEQISDIIKRFKYHGLTTRLGNWNKTNPSPMNGDKMWLSGLEFCVYARKSKSTHNEHCKKATWDAPTGRNKLHTTQKPLALFERLIKASSNEGDTVLDPFMGSGTTGVACGNLGRNFIGIELDTTYYDICKGRIDVAYNV